MRAAVVWSIAAGVVAIALSCGATGAAAAESAQAPQSPVVVADARHAASASSRDHVAGSVPPMLLAQSTIPMTPAVALPPLPAPAPAMTVAQAGPLRVVAPDGGAEPGAFWLLAMGAVLCRLGARVVRTS